MSDHINKIAVTCFTDIKDSTQLTDRLGHAEYQRFLQEHLALGRSLAVETDGKYIKNVGDAHLVTFEAVDGWIAFVVRLQQFYQDSLSCIREPIGVRIGLFLGTIIDSEIDVFGSGVNSAARVEDKAQPGEVFVNEDLVQAVSKALGSDKSTRYFRTTGKHQLKGFRDPVELFSFDWRLYGNEVPQVGLAPLVRSRLEAAGVELMNVSDGDLASAGVVIWPVVPRDIVTAIHRAQVEVLRLLAFLGWEIRVVAADCGTRHNPTRAESSAFLNKLTDYLGLRLVRAVESRTMSDFYDPKYDKYGGLQSTFRDVSAKLSVAKLLAMNKKTYSSEVQEEVNNAATLDFLRPALTAALSLHLAENASPRKVIVLSGADEHIQWDLALDLDGARERIGAVMIPVLNQRSHLGKQTINWPIWNSKQRLATAMAEPGNLARWCFRMHCLLPAFPSSDAIIGGKSISPAIWPNDDGLPEGATIDQLAEAAWGFLDPSLGASPTSPRT